jgi:zinc protease
VISNATPKGGLSFRLGVAVGSFDEADSERGVAHFVEHMAFNGTRTFAEDQLSGAFARMGVGFGRDHNAFTSLNSTTFHLDLPASEPAQVDAAFNWLRDVADGMLFDPAAVDRERGVILAEKEARSDASDAWRERMEAFTFHDLRSQARQPIGTLESINGVPAAQLKTFYDRWYRPENAVVIVAGDAAVDVLEARVKAVFADWRGRGPAGVRAVRDRPQGNRGVDYFVDIDPHAPLAASICRVREPIAGGTEEKFRRGVLGDIWANILEERLTRLANTDAPTLLQARVYGDTWPDAAAECLSVVPTRGHMADAISQVAGEVRRLEAEAPTDTELEEAIEEIRAGYRGQIQDENTKASTDRADEMMYLLLDGRTPQPAREGMRAFSQIVADLTPEAARAAFKADWTGWGPLIRVTSSSALDEGRVRAAWNNAIAAPVQTAEAPKEWPYETFGRDGKVLSRQVVAQPGYTRLKFANGVVVNFKRTGFESGQVLVRVKFGAGRREIPAADYQLALLGTSYLKEGGLGKLSLYDLNSLTRGMAWDIHLDMDDRAFNLDASTYATGLNGQLSILAAYLSDPGFRGNLDELVPNNVETAFRELRSSPADVMGEAFTETIAPGAPINRLSPEKAAAVRSGDLARVMKPIITGEPLQVSIVGDVDEATVIEALSKTLGALPPRKSQPRLRDDTWYMRFPSRDPAPVRVTHDGVPDKAAVGLFWPLFVGSPQQRREEYALGLLGSVFEDRLLARVREKLAKSYSPEADVFLPEGTDQGYLWASVETAPADLGAVEAEVRAVAEGLREGQITEAELEAARRPKLARLDAVSAHNSWWRDVLSVADEPDQLRDFLEGRKITAEITLDEVRKAAAVWLARPPIAVVAAPAMGGKDPRS